MEKAEDIRHTIGNKEIYQQRKETIERLFGTAKEQHGFRYTQYIGKARMEMKAGTMYNLNRCGCLRDEIQAESIGPVIDDKKLCAVKNYMW